MNRAQVTEGGTAHQRETAPIADQSRRKFCNTKPDVAARYVANSCRFLVPVTRHWACRSTDAAVMTFSDPRAFIAKRAAIAARWADLAREAASIEDDTLLAYVPRMPAAYARKFFGTVTDNADGERRGRSMNAPPHSQGRRSKGTVRATQAKRHGGLDQPIHRSLLRPRSHRRNGRYRYRSRCRYRSRRQSSRLRYIQWTLSAMYWGLPRAPSRARCNVRMQ